MLGRRILTRNLCEASILRVGMKQYLRKRTHIVAHVTEWSECLSDMQFIFVVIMHSCFAVYAIISWNGFHKMENVAKFYNFEGRHEIPQLYHIFFVLP